MKRVRLHIMLPALLAGALVASCSGGGAEPGGGIGGSGITTQGTITGFGSIFVNGVEYETDMATIEVDESGALESDLELGMIVTLTGTVNSDGLTGAARNVVVDHKIRGPVINVGPINDDTRVIDVFGVNVHISRTDTVFDGSGFGFDTVQKDDLLRVSGFDAGGGVLQATRVQKIRPAIAGDEVELSGAITDYVADTSFSLGPITVTVSGNTELPDEPLADGRVVEVEGVLQADMSGNLTVIAADEIEFDEDDGLPDDLDDIEVEGIVSTFTDIADFRVGAVMVNARTAEFEPASLATSIGVGTRVEVEGEIRNGVLIADEVKGRGGRVRIAAFVAAEPGAETLQLKLTPTQNLTVLTPTSTVFKDERDETLGFALRHLAVDDYVTIKADVTPQGVRANEVKRKARDDEVKVEAPVESTDFDGTSGMITLLGVTFDTAAATEFERDNDNGDERLDAADFFTEVSAGEIVKLEDTIAIGSTVGDGTAEEVELDDD